MPVSNSVELFYRSMAAPQPPNNCRALLRSHCANDAASTTLSLLLPLLAVLLLGGSASRMAKAVGAAATGVEPPQPLDCTLAYRCNGGREAAPVTLDIPPGPYTEDVRTGLEAALAALADASPQHASYAIAPAAPEGGSAMGTLLVVVDGCAFDGGLAISLPDTAPPLTPPTGGTESAVDGRPVISIELSNANITGGCPVGHGLLAITAPTPAASRGYALRIAIGNTTVAAVCGAASYPVYAFALNFLQLSESSITINNSTIRSVGIGGSAIGLMIQQCVVTDRSRIDLCRTNVSASLTGGQGSVVPVAFLSSPLDGGSALTIGDAELTASVAVGFGSLAAAFLAGGSHITNASIALTGCSITVSRFYIAGSGSLLGTPAYAISLGQLTFGDASVVSLRGSFVYVRNDGPSAGVVYMESDVGKGTVLLHDNSLVVLSSAEAAEEGDPTSSPQQEYPLINVLHVQAPRDNTDFTFAVVNTSIYGAWPSESPNETVADADAAFSVVRVVGDANGASLNLHWLSSGFAYWQEPRAFWDQLTVSQIIAAGGEAPTTAISPSPLSAMSTGLCVGSSPYCAALTVFDNAAETYEQLLPPLLAVTARSASCPILQRDAVDALRTPTLSASLIASATPSASVLAPASPSLFVESITASGTLSSLALLTVSPTLMDPHQHTTAPDASFPPPLVAEVGLIDAVEVGGGNPAALPPAAAGYSPASRAALNAAYWGACGAMEGLLAPRALLAPVALGDLFGSSSGQRHHTYAGTLAVCAVCLAVAAFLGVVAAALSHCCCGTRRSAAAVADADAPQQAGPQRCGVLLAACAAVRFPATLIETFLFLANGAAVAAGMALGGGGGPHAKANGGGDGSMAAAAVTAALLVAAPFVACAAVGQWALRRANAARRDRRRTKKSGGGEGATAVVAEGVTGADPVATCGANEQRYRRGVAKQKERPKPGEGAMQRSLGCLTVVAPASPSSPPLTRSGDLFGPVAGDLRSLHRLASAAPFVLPLALLAASAAVAATERCDALPLAAGAVLAAYAVLVAALRPFVGTVRVGAAAGLAAIASALLFGLYGALAAAPSSAAWGEDETVSALLTALVAVSNCRYPFAVARALGLCAPSLALRCGSFSYAPSSPCDRDDDAAAAAAAVCLAAADADTCKPQIAAAPSTAPTTTVPCCAARSPSPPARTSSCAAEADADSVIAVVYAGRPASPPFFVSDVEVAVSELPTPAAMGGAAAASFGAPLGLSDEDANS